jgi:Cu(I)/Ag(I) efflux system membrane fusion protein
VTTTTAAAPTYGGQLTCPVSGDPLAAAAHVIPVNVRGRVVYVCCQSCAAKVQGDPDTYLAKVADEREGR